MTDICEILNNAEIDAGFAKLTFIRHWFTLVSIKYYIFNISIEVYVIVDYVLRTWNRGSGMSVSISPERSEGTILTRVTGIPWAPMVHTCTIFWPSERGLVSVSEREIVDSAHARISRPRVRMYHSAPARRAWENGFHAWGSKNVFIFDDFELKFLRVVRDRPLV